MKVAEVEIIDFLASFPPADSDPFPSRVMFTERIRAPLQRKLAIILYSIALKVSLYNDDRYRLLIELL